MRRRSICSRRTTSTSISAVRLAPVHLDSGAVQNLNSIWIVVLSPVLVFIYNTLGRAGRDASDCREVCLGLRGRCHRFLHLWRRCALGGGRQGVVVDHGVGIRLVFARRAARQRWTRHDCALTCRARGRLHDGGSTWPLRFSISGVWSQLAHFARLEDPVQSLTSTELFTKLGFAGCFARRSPLRCCR